MCSGIMDSDQVMFLNNSNKKIKIDVNFCPLSKKKNKCLKWSSKKKKKSFKWINFSEIVNCLEKQRDKLSASGHKRENLVNKGLSRLKHVGIFIYDIFS